MLNLFDGVSLLPASFIYFPFELKSLVPHERGKITKERQKKHIEGARMNDGS
jgi:hypothetical protein